MSPIRCICRVCRRSRDGLSAVVVSLPATLLTSCVVFDPGPLHQPVDLVPSEFRTEGESVSKLDKWWEEYAAPELNVLVDSALHANLDLAQAYARLTQARAVAAQRTAGTEPSLEGTARAGTSRARGKGPDGYDTDSYNDFSLGLVAGYELDLWGRVRAGVRSSQHAVTAAEYDLQAAGITIAAETVLRWLRLVAASSELAIVEQQLQTNREYLGLLRARQRKAMASALDVFQQEQVVAATETLLPPIKREKELAHHQLNVLLGRPPGRPVPVKASELPALPPLPDMGLPAELLENRPDLRAAWQRLEAAGWDVSQAQADRMPTIRLTGAATYQSGAFDELFDGWLQNLAASMAAPLLDGGRRKAEVNRARAVLEQQMAAYREAVLVAFREVEDGLSRERHNRDRLTALKQQLASARETLREAGDRYRSGLNDYLPVLTALEAVQRLERSVLLGRYELLVNRVNLCRAAGGKWPVEVLEHYESIGSEDNRRGSPRSAPGQANGSQGRD